MDNITKSTDSDGKISGGETNFDFQTNSQVDGNVRDENNSEETLKRHHEEQEADHDPESNRIRDTNEASRLSVSAGEESEDYENEASRNDYGLTEEVDDSDVKIPEEINQDPSDSDSESEKEDRELVKALLEMGFYQSAAPETSIIIFDRNTEHLQRFNLKDKSVTPMHKYHKEMKIFLPVILGDYIYVLMKRSMYRLEYSDAKGTWEKMAKVIAYHGPEPPAVVVAGMIYVAGFGGLINEDGDPEFDSDGHFTSRCVSKYNPSSDRWENLRKKHLATTEAAIVASKGFVYCIGGYAAGPNAIKGVERMNLVSQTWEEVAPMREERSGASAVECNDKIIVAGGSYLSFSGHYHNSVERYDPNVNQWTKIKPMNEDRLYAKCYVIEGNVYAVGGWGFKGLFQRQGRQTSIEKYDVERNEWEFFHDLGTEIFIYDSVAVEIAIKD